LKDQLGAATIIEKNRRNEDHNENGQLDRIEKDLSGLKTQRAHATFKGIIDGG